MITRAQAEALLTLAESLEACERQGLEVSIHPDGSSILWGDNGFHGIDDLTGMSIRLAVNALIPKQET